MCCLATALGNCGSPDNRASLEQYESLSGELDVTPTALALAWLLSRPGMTAHVLGPGPSTS